MKLNPFNLVKSNRGKQSENFRHAKRGWKKRAPQFSFSKTVLFLCLLFLFLPLLVIIFYSFNASKDTEITGFSFVWYQKLIFDSAPLWHSLLNSFIVAISSSVVATVLGSLAADNKFFADGFAGSNYGSFAFDFF